MAHDTSLYKPAMSEPFTSPPALSGTWLGDTDNGAGLPELPKLPQLTRATFIGIVVAISGNMVISLALNCQKLAHKRLEQKRQEAAQEQELHHHSARSSPDSDILPTHDMDRRRAHTRCQNNHIQADNVAAVLFGTQPTVLAAVETEPLLRSESTTPRPTTYGSDASSTDNHRGTTTYGSDASSTDNHRGKRRRPLLSRLLFFLQEDGDILRDTDSSHLASTHALMPVEIIPVPSNGGRSRRKKDDEDVGRESDYLRSKLWWLGFVLMNIGEFGNFISYAFAPASIVAPLGTFALIANCFFAPVMLKERFRKRDFLGIIIATIGAVTVVLSSNTSDVRLNPDGLLHAITQRPFVIYSAIYLGGAIILSGLSERGVGKRWVYIDVGLCALFGGFTVLSTKALSTLLTLEWFQIFAEWITYPVIATLVITGVGQIRYLNRALMRFDSKLVVPTQFVLFNLSAIVGSAILYGDFTKASFHQIVTFLYGCAATFAGVFIIAWAPSSTPQDEEDDEDDIVPPGIDEENTGFSSRSESLSRQPRVKVFVPDRAVPSPILRSRHSIVSMYGFSPAQRALLLNSPPRDDVSRSHSQDTERDLLSTPDSMRRRRTVSHFGDDAGRGLGSGSLRGFSPLNGTRESSRARTQSMAMSGSYGHTPP